jgi:hypothetical protein
MVEPDTSYRKPVLPFRSDKPRSAWRGHLLARNWPAEGAEILPEYPRNALVPEHAPLLCFELIPDQYALVA